MFKEVVQRHLQARQAPEIAIAGLSVYPIPHLVLNANSVWTPLENCALDTSQR
jgi:hypothetical protein